MAAVQTEDSTSQDKRRKAHSTLIKLALAAWTVQFKNPDYVKETTMNFLEQKICKETLRASSRELEVRSANFLQLAILLPACKASITNIPSHRKSIGTNEEFWEDVRQLLQAANPSLEKRSFTTTDPSALEYEAASGTLIAINAGSLLKDLERLNDVTAIARNVLTIGDAAQKLAAASHVERQIFKLISTCVRVTARGYDGDAGTSDEEKWQMAVNACKFRDSMWIAELG